jgi:dynein light chain roadblock-type
MSSNEADDTFKRLIAYPGVYGVIIMNSDGIPIRSSLNPQLTITYVSLIHGFSSKARTVIKEMDNQNEVTFIRLRSNKDEVLIAPDKEFTMIVIQKPVVGSSNARGMFFSSKDK